MARGKQTCRILKEIRRQIAAANDIEFITTECRYKGDCLGTCPKCEAEVRYLEQQLRKRQLAGKAIALAGLSAGAVAMFAPVAVQSQTPDASLTKGYAAAEVARDTIVVKGVVLDGDTLQDGTVSREPMVGGLIRNLRTEQAVATDKDGRFQIEAFKGDLLEVSYIGYKRKLASVTDDGYLEILLGSEDEFRLGEFEAVPMAGAYGPLPDGERRMLYLYIVDENNKLLSYFDIDIDRIYINEDGEEESEYVSLDWSRDKGVYALDLDYIFKFHDEDDVPLKEAVFRIGADGYGKPKTFKVKYPKRNIKKTIKFKKER